MGIIFKLVVNLGNDEWALAAATNELNEHPTVELRGAPLPVTPPFVMRMRPGIRPGFIEFSVHPRGLSYSGPGPTLPFDTKDVGDDELTAVGEQLYDLLRRLDSYDAAIVGWDPELLVDLVELESDRLPDGSISKLDGLVLSDTLIDRWRLEGFVPFAPGHSWLPYRGSSNIW